LMSTIISAPPGSKANAAGKINDNEMKLTSITQIWTGSAISAAVK